MSYEIEHVTMFLEGDKRGNCISYLKLVCTNDGALIPFVVVFPDTFIFHEESK